MNPVHSSHGHDDIRHSFAMRVVRRLPRAIILSPEQVVLNFAFVVIGVAAFFSIEGSLTTEWQPDFVHIAWALAMIVGGGSVLLGLFRSNSTTERLGYLLTGPACLWFGVSALIYRGLPGLTVFLIFFAIFMIKVLRMVLSSAARDTILELGRRWDREDTEDS
jgi:hypothetical protein